MSSLKVISTGVPAPAGPATNNPLPSVRCSKKSKARANKQSKAQRNARLALPKALPPRTAADRDIVPVQGSVPNPYDAGRMIEVTINRRTDILQDELSHRRINRAEFLTGREIQTVFEMAQASGTSGWSDGDRVDAELAKEMRIIRSTDIARRIKGEMDRLTKEIGDVGARFLRAILTGTTFAQYAAARGRSGERAVSLVADRFRWFLEEITNKRAARGKVK